MAKNSKFLKKLLTTASALSLVALTANSAMAVGVARQLVGPDGVYSTGADLDQAAGGPLVPIADLSSIQWAVIPPAGAGAPAAVSRIVVDNAVGTNIKTTINSAGNDLELQIGTAAAPTDAVFAGIAGGTAANPVRIAMNHDGSTVILGLNLDAAGKAAYGTAADVGVFNKIEIDFVNIPNARVDLNEDNTIFDINFSATGANPANGGTVNFTGTNSYLIGRFAQGVDAINIFNVGAGKNLFLGRYAMPDAAVPVAAVKNDMHLKGPLNIAAGSTAYIFGDSNISAAAITGPGTLQVSSGSTSRISVGALGTVAAPLTAINIWSNGVLNLAARAAGQQTYATITSFDTPLSTLHFTGHSSIWNSNLVNTNATAGVSSGIVSLDVPGVEHQINGNIGATDKHLLKIIFNVDNILTLNAAVVPGVFVDDITTVAANTGTLQINQGPNVTITSNIGTDALPLGAVNIIGDGVAGLGTGPTNVTLAANKAIYAAIDLGALQNNLIFEDSTTITGNITAQAPSNNDLTFQGTTVITGNIGTGDKMKQLIMNKGSNVLVRGGVAADNAHLDASSILILQGAASIDNVNFKAQDSAMQLSQFAYILNSNLVNTNATAGVPSGILLFDAPAGTAHQITGNIGANDQRLSSIIFNADNTLTLNAAVAPGVFVDRINTKVANTGTLQINQGPNVTITSDIGMLAMPFGAVNILGDGVAGPATGPTNVTLAANKAIYAAIDLGALQNNLIFEDSTTITGNITAQAPSNNDLTFEGTTLITGNIGTGNKMKQLIMNKGSKVLVTGDVAASKASLAEESKLTLKGAAAINIDSVHFEAQDSTMQLSGISSTLTGNLVNEGTARNSRGVLLTGDVAGIEHKIAGDVGGANQHLFGIYFGADNTLTLRPGGVAGVASNPGVFVDYIATDATGNGTIQVSQGADVTIHSNIGTEVPASAATGNDILPAYALKAVNIIDDGAGGVTNVTLTANKAIHAKTISLGVINNKLTLKDGTSITGNIVTSTPSKGTLTFDKGAVSTITGEIGTSNKISEINVGEGSTVTVTGSVSADNSYLANDSQLILQGAAIDIGTVQTNNDKQGTLTFKGGDQVFTGSLGVAGSQLKTVEFASGGNVRLDLTAPVNVESLSFTTADDSQITINKDLSATNITTVSEAKNQDFLISAMQSITGEVGSAQHPLGDFILNDSIIVLNTPTFHAGIATDTAGKGSATLTQIPEGIRDIGTNDKPLLHVTLGVNNNDVTNIYANTILISGDLRLNPSTLSCNTLLVSAPVLPNISVTINVRDGEITAPILSKADNTTNIVFNGDVTLSENVGSNTVINGFAAAKMRQITFNRNITLKDSIDLYSTNIVFNNINDANLKRDLIFAEGVSGKTVNFHGNSAMINYNITTGQNTIAFDGQASLTNSTMSANGGKITFNNELVAKSSAISIDAGSSIEFSGGETSTFTGTTPITVSYNNNAVGAIIADGTGTIVDFTGVADDSTITISAVGAGRISGTYSIIQNNNGGVVNLGKNFTYNTDPFSKWELVDASTGTFLVKDTAGAVTRQILKVANASSASDTNAQVFADLSADLTAGALFDELLEVGRIDKVAMIEAYERISHNTVVVTAEATKSATAQVTARIGDGSNALINQDDSIVNPQSAPAAGERDVLRYGIWGNPIYGQGVQKQRKGMSGYKTKSSGITVGFDTMANDTMLVGVAATAARTDIKHKNVNSGDRSRGNTLLFSIYGLQLVNDKFFVQGVASLGTTKVKNSSTRVGYANGAITRDSVSGNYDSMSWGGELMAGFNVNSFGLGNMTPMLGMDYNRVTDAGFKETGSRNQNFTIYSKPVESLRAIAGVKAVVFSTNYNNMYVTPEVHAFIKQGLVNKNPAMAISLDGTPVVVNNAKPTKTSYNLGASLNTTNGMMQYGITYDANIAQKYVGHQGSVKLRMNF